ncbi:MAG: hypothetical protein Q4A74_07620 [Cardiobacteriaceae bacterium]|nr:hypothetical protein [Cardiobacteriaceae bacterium]
MLGSHNLNKKVLAGLLLFIITIASAHARIFIINAQDSINPIDFNPPQNNLPNGNIDASRAMLLQYYHYHELQIATTNRQKNIQLLTQQIKELSKQGANAYSIEELKNYVIQMNEETQKSLEILSKFALKEFKQLYDIEEQNSKQIKVLDHQISDIKIIDKNENIPSILKRGN